MDLEHILYTTQDHVARITINRPEVRNALNERCHRELRAVFEHFRADDDAWVAVLSGSGDKAFCAGADLKAAAARNAAGEPPPDIPWGGITRDWECWKPIIASVNGFALGGGTELALACDLVVAADTATFGLPEPRRGIAAGAGGLLRLTRQLPLKQAMHLILTGRRLGADEAHDLGLVNIVVPPDELATATDALVDEILECSPVAVRFSKQIAMSTSDKSIEEGFVHQRELLTALLASEDAREGPRAFAEKRSPEWKGR